MSPSGLANPWVASAHGMVTHLYVLQCNIAFMIRFLLSGPNSAKYLSFPLVGQQAFNNNMQPRSATHDISRTSFHVKHISDFAKTLEDASVT